MKQVAPPPCPEWYGDREWNVNLWGTYAFTNTEFAPNPSLIDIVQSTSEGGPVLGTYDRYIGGDHAWGGGGDVKYFFCRYVGLGVEGFALDASKPGFDIFEDQTVPIFINQRINHDHTIGAVLGTLTLRYPIPCTRLAPYAWGGVGAIFGGGERDNFIHKDRRTPLLSMRRPTISAAKPKCSPNSGPVSKSDSRATSVGLTT